MKAQQKMSKKKKKKLNKLVGVAPPKKQRRRDSHAALLLLVLLLLGVWAVFVVVWKVVTRVPTAQQPRTPGVSQEILIDQQSRLLDGMPVETEQRVSPAIVAAAIDFNHDGYPVSGVEHARVVYEVPTEGGVTRLLALFTADTTISEIGPIRSARPYMNDIAAAYDAAYLHVGGSPAAMANLRQRDDLINLDQYYSEKYSWRDGSRYAPHNTYSSSALWKKALENNDHQSSSFKPWSFSTDRLWISQKAHEIIVPSTRESYSAVWKYEDGRYRRYYDGALYQTRTGGRISADTILVAQKRARVLDNEGRISITGNTGKAWMFRDGKVVTGSWLKKGKREFFETEKGEPFELRPGSIWVHWITNGLEPQH